MGSRGQVLVRDNGVYLYTHCGKNEMLEQVQETLTNYKPMWKDPDNMTSLISDKIMCDGIGNKFVYCYQLIILDFMYQRVKIIDYPTSDESKVERDMTFEEFLEIKE